MLLLQPTSCTSVCRHSGCLPVQHEVGSTRLHASPGRLFLRLCLEAATCRDLRVVQAPLLPTTALII